MDAEREERKLKGDRFKQQQIQQLSKFKRRAVTREQGTGNRE